MTEQSELPTRSLSDLPDDELRAYGRELGLDLPDDLPRGELLRRVRERRELLLELDREALLDVVVWARRPVRQSASKETLARQIAEISRVRFDGLSRRGLDALARLRGLSLRSGESRPELERRLRKREGLWAKVRRKRRAVMADLVARAFQTNQPEDSGVYRFLPEEDGPSLKKQIEDEGVVGGIARKLRGVADDYVREKLDEIENRIDSKLDEIDKRLGEWRDREVSNRLKILKITLIFSILVALICLAYDMVIARYVPERTPAAADPSERISLVWPVRDGSDSLV